MSDFCQDRDLLSIEPGVFIGGGFPSQELISGSDGVISGTTFTSSASNFTAACVEAGMVLCTYTTTAAEGSAFEIVSADSTTSLNLSVLRAGLEAASVAPPAGSNLHFYIRTFGPQIRTVSAALSEKLRQIVEVSGVDAADYADSAQLRITAAHGALAAIFVARSENAVSSDVNWIKAQYYHDCFRRLQLQLRLAVDADGDGLAERTRTLGNVTLRRI